MLATSFDDYFITWPSWRRLIFVLDNKYEYTRWEEDRVIVWNLLDEGHDIYVREGDEISENTDGAVCTNNDEVV